MKTDNYHPQKPIGFLNRAYNNQVFFKFIFYLFLDNPDSENIKDHQQDICLCHSYFGIRFDEDWFRNKEVYVFLWQKTPSKIVCFSLFDYPPGPKY